MKQTIALIGLCLVLSQLLPAFAQEEGTNSPVEIPSDVVDQRCEIALHSMSVGSSTTEAGKIVRIDDATVVLVDATRTVRVESSVPILGSIPYLGRLFRNTSVAVENVSGELSIDRREIKSVKIAD